MTGLKIASLCMWKSCTFACLRLCVMMPVLMFERQNTRGLRRWRLMPISERLHELCASQSSGWWWMVTWPPMCSFGGGDSRVCPSQKLSAHMYVGSAMTRRDHTSEDASFLYTSNTTTDGGYFLADTAKMVAQRWHVCS